MKRSLGVLVILAFASFGSELGAQNIQSTTLDGGSVVTDLGYNIKVNKDSTLHRSRVVLNDSGCPIQLTRAGVVTAYDNREYSFSQVGTFMASEPVAAFEVRYVLYDMFGKHMKTLSAVSVSDIVPGTLLPLSEAGAWRAWENDVSEFLTAVAFVAHVRTKDGKVWRFQEKAVTEELAKTRLAAGSNVLDATKIK